MANGRASSEIEQARVRLQHVMPPTETRVFHTLDGMRGAAAIAVALLHTPSFTQTPWFGAKEALQCAFLGVDLFFVLSGFVIAHAYEQRLLAGMRLTTFLKLRAHRLAPLYILGLAMAVAQIAASRLVQPNVWTPADLALVALGALVLIPVPIFGLHQVLYLLNPATWTLAAEILVNLVYAFAARHLTTGRLMGLCIAAAAVLLWVAWRFQSIDLGITWMQFPAGVARAVYGFCAGVLMFRLYRNRPLAKASSGWIWMGLLLALLLAPLSGTWLAPCELVCALLVFPLLVYVAASSAVGAFGQKVCGSAGTASYALYILHTPIGRTAVLVADVFHWSLANDIAAAGLMAVFIVLSLAADALYDRPIRRWIKWFDRTHPPFDWPDRERRLKPRD